MENFTTNTPVYSFDLDFDNLTGSCDYNIKGIDIVINFNFSFDITNVEYSKEDYFVPDTWSYDFEHDIDIVDAYYYIGDKPYKVTEHHRQTLIGLIESDIKNHIDENDLYKD